METGEWSVLGETGQALSVGRLWSYLGFLVQWASFGVVGWDKLCESMNTMSGSIITFDGKSAAGFSIVFRFVCFKFSSLISWIFL